MGQVVRTARWWGKVERTQTENPDREPVTIQPVSLDVLSDQVARAMNAVVHSQAELTRAEMHLERCQQAWVNRCIEVAKQNGIKDFTVRKLELEE
jgi:hypothetical protein